MASLTETLEHATFADQVAAGGGWLQTLDPRTKLAVAMLLVTVTVATPKLEIPACVLMLSLLLALSGRICLHVFAVRIWLGIFFFTGLIALPAVFLVPGTVIARVPLVDWPLSSQGLLSAARLVLRAETTATVALLLILSTPWTHVLKALRIFRVPVIFVMILGMTQRYIFLLLQLARNLFDARRSRHVGPMDGGQRRRVAASAAGVLLSRSLQIGSDVFLAMQSRGFRGEIPIVDEFKFRTRDWLNLSVITGMAAALLAGGI